MLIDNGVVPISSEDDDEYVVAVAKSEIYLNLLLRFKTLIGCVFLDGHAYVWDCRSSQLLYTVRDTNQELSRPEATGIAWCSGNKEKELPLFVCGKKGGGLTIWEGRGSEPNQDLPSEPTQGASL